MVSSVVVTIATNAVTTMMIAYRLWYVALNETHESSGLPWRDCRSHCKFILKTLRWSRQKSLVQMILLLLVESGLVFLVIQVSYFGICLLMSLCKILKVLTLLTDSILVDQCVWDWWYSSICSICLSSFIFFSCHKCWADWRFPLCAIIWSTSALVVDVSNYHNTPHWNSAFNDGYLWD